MLNNLFLVAPQQGGNPLGSFLPIILIMVVFYFFMIRPQMKKAKEQKQFRESLRKGDRIVTIGGIHGKIIELEDTTLIIETEGQGRLKIERSAVSSGAGDTLQTKKD